MKKEAKLLQELDWIYSLFHQKTIINGVESKEYQNTLHITPEMRLEVERILKETMTKII